MLKVYEKKKAAKTKPYQLAHMPTLSAIFEPPSTQQPEHMHRPFTAHKLTLVSEQANFVHLQMHTSSSHISEHTLSYALSFHMHPPAIIWHSFSSYLDDLPLLCRAARDEGRAEVEVGEPGAVGREEEGDTEDDTEAAGGGGAEEGDGKARPKTVDEGEGGAGRAPACMAASLMRDSDWLGCSANEIWSSLGSDE